MLFAYNENSPEIQHLIKADAKLKWLIQKVGDLRYDTDDKPYEFLVSSVIGQMLSNKVADVIYKRFHALCDGIVTPTRVAELSKEKIRTVGISSAKADTILELTSLFLSTPNLPLILQSSSDSAVTEILTQVKGIGKWTAKMYLIFVLNRMDVLPYEDGAFIQAFERLYDIKESNKNKPMTRAHCKAWSPYSSLAARYLYIALDDGHFE